ncbi:MAG TPA: hypothetical protein PLU30_27710 [Verrucomicrobiae bacterium]|nr:hypothetical protein [Verrucomicrobiae bacterium]
MSIASGSSRSVTRRSLLQAGIGTLAAAGAAVAENKPPAPAAGEGLLPQGNLCGAKIGRVLLGGNLISGYMHSRDLKYVNALFKAYATEAKILETLRVAESHGINTVFETGAQFVQRYNREFGGKMQFIPHIQVDTKQSETELNDHIAKQADSGAVALYVWGVAADKLLQAGEIDRLARAVELAKVTGLPVGVGAHSLLVPMACEKHGIPCDFYVKTLHRDNYPSATPKELRKEFIWLAGGEGWYDNMWCINPEETVGFMASVKKPWIAFKVLAAGAIHPRDGFAHAFQSGADFIAVGMMDFQIAENCRLAGRCIAEAKSRPRPWCA